MRKEMKQPEYEKFQKFVHDRIETDILYFDPKYAGKSNEYFQIR